MTIKLCRRIKFNNKKVSLGFLARYDKNCVFEGYNHIGICGKLSDSYMGLYSYIGEFSDLTKAHIGKFCSIGSRVKIVAGDHPTRFVSTHLMFFERDNSRLKTFVNENKWKNFKFVNVDGKDYFCQIGNDVWIGSDVRILNGVKIGDGAVIAAGAVVVKDVPPYAIWGGTSLFDSLQI